MARRFSPIAVVSAGLLLLNGCAHLGLLRPNRLKQLNTRVVNLVNEMARVDHPNEDIVGRLFAHGGLAHAKRGNDGVMRARIHVPPNQFIWEPAIIVMPQSGDLELEFHNEDTGGRARVRLDEPGLYWFGCPVANHAGRGMLGLIMVRGNVPADARLDRPEQERP
jgi:hypothetical protein